MAQFIFGSSNPGAGSGFLPGFVSGAPNPAVASPVNAGSAQMSNGGAGTNGDNSNWQGFVFTPPPLILNGQQVAGGLNFTAAQPVAQVDQASQAYGFINNVLANSFGFTNDAINSAQTSFANIASQVVPVEQQWGTGLLGALQTEANAFQTLASNYSTPCSGLFCF